MHVNDMVSSPFTDYCIIDVTDLNFGTYLVPFVQISVTSNSRRTAVSRNMLAKCQGLQPDFEKAMVQ